MTWKRYPAYKDSGMEWLHDLPRGWKTKRTKYVCSINDESLGEDTDPELQISYVDIGSVDPVAGIVKTEQMRFEGAPSRARRIVKDGDTVVSTVRTYLRAIAPIESPEPNLTVSTGFAVLRPGQSVIPGYCSYAFRSPYFVETVVSRSVGVSYPAVNASDIGDIPLAIPSSEEQQAIATFLDRETARIDRLIEKKERQIELLKEKRAALISHMMTSDGAGAVLSRRDGRWTEARLGRFIKLQRGFDISGASEHEDGFPVYSSGGLSGFADLAMVKGPGVIVGRKGTLGTVHFSMGDYWPHDTTLWVKEFRGNLPRFVYYYLMHMKLEQFDVGAANPTLNRNHVHPIPACLSDRGTQEKIACVLDDAVAEQEALLDRIRVSVGLLREYRTALISAAVTGKTDVREAVA